MSRGRAEEGYEHIPFDDAALPIRLNVNSRVTPGTAPYRPEHTTWHEQMELLVPRDGLLTVHVGEESLTAQPGEAVLIHPFESHQVVDAGHAARYDCLMIDAALYCDAGRTGARWPDLLAGGNIRFDNRLSGDAELMAQIDAVCRELTVRQAAYDLAVRAHVTGLLVCLFRRHLAGGLSPEQLGANAARYDRVEPAVDLIRQDLSRRPSVEEMAAVCHLSPSHFSRLFRQITGFSPLQFDTDLRLREAAARLRRTDDSVGDIAAALGFEEVGYLSRKFKKKFGLTPTAARHQPEQKK